MSETVQIRMDRFLQGTANVIKTADTTTLEEAAARVEGLLPADWFEELQEGREPDPVDRIIANLYFLVRVELSDREIKFEELAAQFTEPERAP